MERYEVTPELKQSLEDHATAVATGLAEMDRTKLSMRAAIIGAERLAKIRASEVEIDAGRFTIRDALGRSFTIDLPYAPAPTVTEPEPEIEISSV